MSASEPSRREEYTAVRVPADARLLLATQNEHKLREVREILAGVLAPYGEGALISMRGLGIVSPVEDGVTFEENALIKARAAAKATKLPVLADDSGLAVDVLGGAPGVFSARWAGGHGGDAANLQLLLDQLADVPRHHRGARFECAAVLVTPDRHEFVEKAHVDGSLLRRPKGDGGFGYDPIFQPVGHARSMAELSASEKNAISHRARAFGELRDEVASVLARG